MANSFATGWMRLFKQMRQPSNFLQSFFTMKPGNAYNGKKIELDIQRFGEDVAVAMKAGTEANINDVDLVTTKEFTPPAYGEAVSCDVNDLVERTAGVDQYSDAYNGYAAKLIAKLNTAFQVIRAMITRSVELQASQILQTGTLTLTDRVGGTVYVIDFKPKATHFPTVSTSWSAAGADPLGDLQSLIDVIRSDGQVNANQAIFGAVALKNFLANTDVQANLDNRRVTIGEIRPRQDNRGATFYGFVWIGAYMVEIWTYAEGYKHAQTGAFTKYVDDDKVILTSSDTRLDYATARVPLPLGPDPRVANIMPGRLMDTSTELDVTPNLYCTPNGKQIMAELESRPLLVPVQIDGFGCLDTEI
jgi:hypothetical protein